MRRATALGAAFALALPGAASAAGDGSTGIVDRPSGFGALPFDGLSNSDLGPRTISADGCFLVFESDNDALFAGDENDASNIFRKDRCSAGHPLEQVNTSAAGAQPDPGRFAESPSISADGKFVAFASDDPNLSPDANGSEQAWVKNMDTGAVELASRADGATLQLAPGGTYAPVISGDGRHVVFPADGIFAGANTSGLAGQTNAYVRDLQAGKTYLASVVTAGTAGGGVNAELDISFDGSAVAFVSSAQLTAGDSDTDTDAYLARGIGPSPTQTLVSFTAGQTSGAQTADDVALSSDGKWVAWTNGAHPWAAKCDPGCTAAANLDFNVDPGVTANQGLSSISFGYSGTTVAAAAPTHVFWTTTAALTAGDSNGAPDLYTHSLADLSLAGLARVTSGTDALGTSEALASDDAALAMFRSSSPALPGSNGFTRQVFLQQSGGTIALAQPEGQSLRVAEVGSANINDLHAVGPNGRYTVFASNSPSLGIPFTVLRGFPAQAFIRDETSGTTTPVSVSSAGAFADGTTGSAGVDAAGDRVAFMSLARNLATGVTPDFENVYVRDLAAGTTTLLNRTTGGTPSSHGAVAPEISADGRTVVFESASPDLPGATPSDSHVYAADLDAGTVTLVDATSGGTPGDHSALAADVSADGSRVAFVSLAGNLGGSAGHASVYVKNRTTGAVTWASVPEDGNPLHSSASDVSISADGQRVAFTDSDPLFGFGSNGAPHVYLRDLAAATTTLVSVGTPGGPGSAQRRPSLSADAGRVSFTEGAFPGHPARTYLRDLVAGTTTQLESGAHGSSVSNLDPTGTCAAFASSSAALTDPGYPGPDFSHVYVRAIGGDCPHVAPAPGPGGGGGGGPQADTTAPVISGVRVTHKRFRLAHKRTALSAAKRAKRGTTFVFTLSEAARTTIAIAQRKAGRRKGKKCVRPRKGLHRRCTRYVAKLTLTRRLAAQGANRVAYTGRTSKGALRPGRYRATLRATDAAGNRSAARVVTFRVVRR